MDKTQAELDRCLFLAVEAGDREAAKALLEQGASPDASRWCDELHALAQAVIGNDIAMMRLLIDHGARVDCEDSYGRYALTFAAIKGHYEAAKLLIEKGAKLEPYSEMERVPLIEAAMLEDAYNAGAKDGSDVVTFGHYECGENTEEILGKSRMNEAMLAKFPVTLGTAGKCYMKMTISSLWNKIFRRETVCRNGLTMLAVPNADDLTFACTMCGLANKISLLPGHYVYYRRARPGNWMTRRREFFHAYVEAIVAMEWNLRRLHRMGMREKSAFRYCVMTSCNFELSLCQSKQETKEKMALFDRRCGRELGYYFRYQKSKGIKRHFYHILSDLCKLSPRKPRL